MPSHDPAGTAANAEFAQLVRDCLDRLPAAHREILTIRNIQHRSYEEIAAILGITVGTVKSRVARARENVRRKLCVLCPEFQPDDELHERFERFERFERNHQAGRLALAVA